MRRQQFIVVAEKIQALNRLRTSVEKYHSNHNSKEDVIEKIRECRGVGANTSMILIIANAVIPKEEILRLL